MKRQATIGRQVWVQGVGLRAGNPAQVRLLPAAVDAGRSFVVGGVAIPATVEQVVDATLATTLGANGKRIALVEHLLAALAGAGIDNVEVHVEGDELPILDGTAMSWLGVLAGAGVREQDAQRRVWTVSRRIRVEDGASWAELSPSTAFTLDVRVDFPHAAIGAQRWTGVVDGAFGSDLAWARTFGFRADAERLQAMGIARGASLDNTLVFDVEGPMNVGGQRAFDEVVRHKALDAVGDLALVPGYPGVLLRTERAGHRLHHAVLREAISAGLLVSGTDRD